MCRIFTPNQIQQREFPTPQDFEIVTASVTRQLRAWKPFHGAIIGGSVLMGEPKPWSDLDVLVMYRVRNEEDRHDAIEFIRMLVKEAYERHVPLSVIPVERALARRGMHNVTLGFRDHLLWARDHRGLVGQDPLAEILVRDSLTQYKTEAVSYLSHAYQLLSRNLTRWDELGEEERNRIRHKAIDMPPHAARRMLECIGVDCSRLSRSEVTKLYSERADEARADRLWKITRFSEMYFAELEKQFGHPDEDAYAALLEEFEPIIHEAVQFMCENLYKWLDPDPKP